MSLAKVTIVKSSVKIRRYALCSGVAACYVQSIVVYMLCAVQNETELCQSRSAQHTTYTTVTLARFKYELTDNGHRPKHVGAF